MGYIRRLSARKKLLCFYKRYGIVLTFRALLHYVQVRSVHVAQSAFGVGQSDRIQDLQKRSVLFITFSYQSNSKRYRVEHVAEYMSAAGAGCDIIPIEDLRRLWSYALSFPIIVISHLPLDTGLQRFVDEAKRMGRILAYSMDDPLFLSDVMKTYFRLPQEFGEREKEFYYAEADMRLALLKQCDCFIASTEYLANQVRELSITAYVIRNGFSHEMIQISERVLAQKKELKRKHNGKTIIGYFSGTRTHNHDVTFTTEALLRILAERPSVELWVYGYLDLDPRFKTFKKQIRRHALVSWKKLPYEIAQTDINIAPLEMGSGLTEAKSEIKYSESALVKVPTVASATDSYRYAIQHGVTGLLAQTSEDWYAHLSQLIDDVDMRTRMGESAYAYVLSRYCPESMSREAHTVFDALTKNHAASL